MPEAGESGLVAWLGIDTPTLELYIKGAVERLQSGRSAAWLARLHGVQEAGGSNPLAPTKLKVIINKDLQQVTDAAQNVKFCR